MYYIYKEFLYFSVLYMMKNPDLEGAVISLKER
jgi:hypothetical protein